MLTGDTSEHTLFFAYGTIARLSRDRSTLSPANANRAVYDLLKNGVRVKVTVKDTDETLLARVMDWAAPENNDFLLVSQFWVTGDVYTRRADLVGFVTTVSRLCSSS